MTPITCACFPIADGVLEGLALYKQERGQLFASLDGNNHEDASRPCRP
jgi:hypothetical protein